MKLIRFDDLPEIQNSGNRNSIFISFFFRETTKQTGILTNFKRAVSIDSIDNPMFDGYQASIGDFNEFYYKSFAIPNSPDGFVIQIGINSKKNPSQSWPAMRSYLHDSLNAWYTDLPKDTLWGYTMVYKMDIYAAFFNGDFKLSPEIINAMQPLFAPGTPVEITRDFYSEGVLMLADAIPDQDCLIYAVIGNGNFSLVDDKKVWNQIVPKVVYGPNAVLQYCDAYYHKANYLRKQVSTGSYNNLIAAMQEKSSEILKNLYLSNHQEIQLYLSDLSIRYNDLVVLHNDISLLSVSAQQQTENQKNALQFNKEMKNTQPAFLKFLFLNISTNSIHLSLLTGKGKLALDKMRQTLEFVRLRGNEFETNLLEKFQRYLAIVGIILASLQIIDHQSAKLIWNAVMPAAYKSEHEADFFQGVMLTRIVVAASITALAFWLYRYVSGFLKKPKE